MRATQMDIIIEKLNSCSEQIQKARDQLTIQAKLSEKLKKSQDEAEHKLKQFRSTEPLKVNHQFKMHKLLLIYYYLHKYFNQSLGRIKTL